MSSPRVVLVLLLLLSLCAAADEGQTAAPKRKGASRKTPATKPSKPGKAEENKPADYSQEPFVFEQYKETYRFENDGTGTREQAARIRVQSDAGVQALGQLVFGYNSANETQEIKYVRVRKADGTVVTAATDAAQDLPSPIEREAPVYTDYREKHVTVPGLRPGEMLEYDVLTTIHTPLVAGQFFLSHDFERRAIVLDERLEVDVPSGRTIRLKTQPGYDPRTQDTAGRRIYSWNSSHLEVEKKDDPKKKGRKKREGEDRPPAVQMSTFSSWEELGKWYAGLEKDRVAPTPEIRAKAEELTRGKETDAEKIEALYDYVATNFRYVSLSFGLGRLQPHAAGAILGNQYGDCKDKHTLLASLLESVGIHADAVMINSQRRLDPDIPAPSQFDHMITAIPQGDSYLWLDTTTEVAPYRLLVANLRNKLAVVIGEDGSAKLVGTPGDPPFLNRRDVTIQGKVNELGKLEARVQQRLRGDQEVVLRYLFRRTPESKWEELAQELQGYFGMIGEVSEVKASNPTNTKEAFELTYKIEQAGYMDWSSKESQTYVYLPAIGIPDAEADPDSAEPIKIGSPSEVMVKLKLEMPDAFTVKPPIPFRIKRDYGEYIAKYSVEGHTLTAERTIRINLRELPSGRASDYASFRKVIRGDEEQKLAVASKVAGTPGALKDAKADELYDAGLGAYRNQNFDLAAQLLKRVVQLEPKHKSAWNDLGQTYIVLNRLDDAIEAFQKQVEAEPFHQFAYNNLGLVYWRQQKYEQAAAAFEKQLEVNPLDEYAHGNLGSMYCEWKKYAEAVPELEKGISLKPDNPNLQVSLGDAYLNLDQPDKAVAAFDKAVEIAPNPGIWNNVAYQLAEKGAHLDRAQQYAESAVAAIAASLRNVDLEHVRVQEAALVSGLGAYWDTLGWVHFKKGDLDNAEKYVKASWQLMQHGEVGDHLGQIFEKRGRKQEAIHMYALALAAYRPVPETRPRLAALLGDDKKVDAEVAKAKPELDGLRSVRVPAIGKDAMQADFLVLLTGPKAEQVKFVKGDNKLQALVEALRGAKFNVQFPDDTPTKILRRGTVSCNAGQTECTFTMVPPDTVNSVN